MPGQGCVTWGGSLSPPVQPHCWRPQIILCLSDYGWVFLLLLLCYTDLLLWWTIYQEDSHISVRSKKAQTLPPQSPGFRCTREQNLVLPLWSSNMSTGTKGKALLDTWCHLYILTFQPESLFSYILPTVHCFFIHVLGINTSHRRGQLLLLQG